MSGARWLAVASLAGCVAWGGCAGDPAEGLGEAKRAGGPVVRWDLQHKPLPEIPLPNDAATRLDPTSPTGRRVNVSLLAPTFLESDLRAKADELSGFGIFQPITVAFDAPLDLQNVLDRQVANADPKDDVAYLLNVDRDSEGFGERVPLDFSGGPFPLALEKTANYFDNDPRKDSMNLVFETVQEDRNCNGALDPGEDTDFDGVLDRPNTFGLEWHEDANCNEKLDPGEDWDCDGELDLNPAIADGLHEDANCNGVLDDGEDRDCDGGLDVATGALTPAAGDTDGDLVLDEGETWDCGAVVGGAGDLLRGRQDAALADHLTYFWERETQTLIMRPIVPLREHTTYAVVLTQRLVGEDGKPVESPFPFTNHAAQTGPLEALGDAAKKAGVSVDDLAFAWTYTTGSVTWEMEQIRAGLYGEGPFARFATEFPVESLRLDRMRDDEDLQPYIARYADFEAPLGLLAVADGLGAGVLPYLDSVSHIVVGTFRAPNFLVDRNGLAMEGYPADDDEVFDLDAQTGEARVGNGRVTFWCAIPKTVPGLHEQPFPVEVFGHGYGSSKFELMPQMGRMAKFGIAACGIDAYGHGTGPAAEETIDIGTGPKKIRDLAYEFFHQVQLGNFVLAVLSGRERDLDNDGIGDPGGDFWTADTFHTRDIVRQSVVDHLQLFRILRAFDGEHWTEQDTNADGMGGDVLGDFDGDGTPDLGGPGVRYSMWGSSLGGILSGILAGLEPVLDAAAPHAGGAGLLDIALRSRQGGVPEAVFLPLLGPLVSFNPVKDTNPEQIELTFVVNNVARTGTYPFYRTTKIAAGDRVVLRNTRNGEVKEALVPTSRRFRLAVAADALSATQKRRLLGYGPAPDPDAALNGVPEVAEAVGPTPIPAPADPTEVGDPLVIEVWAPGADAPKLVIDTFGLEVVFQGARHPAGSTLVALASGFGFQRNTPELRRFTGIASMILQSADPVGYAPHYWKDPLEFPYDDATPGTNVLVLPMTGDMNVPVNTEVMMAVAAGTVSHDTEDERLGMSQLAWLVENHVMEGLERLWRYDLQVDVDADKDCTFEGSVRRLGSFDVDDADEGSSEFHAPSDVPLRATIRTADGDPADGQEHCNTADDTCGTILKSKGGLNAMRMPYTQPDGAHDLPDPNPCRKFDVAPYYQNLVAYWFHTGGTELPDHLCLARESCDFFPWEENQ